LTTRLDVFESIVSAVAVAAGLWLAGFWGLLAAVGVILTAKIAYLHAHHPLRFRWAWEGPAAWRLMRVGLPILSNTAAFAAALSTRGAWTRGLAPEGDPAAGLSTIALLGTGWSLALAGRPATVLSPSSQTTLGRSDDRRAVALRAARAAESLAPV